MAVRTWTKCPYCRCDNSLEIDPDSDGHEIIVCRVEGGGCDRYYVVFWRVSVHAEAKAIDGQGELRKLADDFSDVSCRLQLCMKNASMKTWDDVIKADRSAWEWLRTPNFGRKALNELKLELQMRGVALRDK